MAARCYQLLLTTLQQPVTRAASCNYLLLVLLQQLVSRAANCYQLLLALLQQSPPSWPLRWQWQSQERQLRGD